MNNTIKVRENDNLNFLDGEDDFKRGNKRGWKLYDKENDNKNKKIRIVKLDKYYGERKKFEF